VNKNNIETVVPLDPTHGDEDGIAFGIPHGIRWNGFGHGFWIDNGSQAIVVDVMLMQGRLGAT